jgi:hypothetical protein
MYVGMNVVPRALSVLIVLLAAGVVGCLDDGSRSTSLFFGCEGCDAEAMAAGDVLSFEVGWTGTAWSGGFGSSERATCDPYRVKLQCFGVACETTRNNSHWEFWSLAQAAAREPSGPAACSPHLDTFEVRPVEGGALTLLVELRNLATDEVAAYRFGPIAVSPPTVEPRASCNGSEWDRVAMGVPIEIQVAWDGQPGCADPLGRQPFFLDLDCGEVPCEMQIPGSSDYEPMERLFVPTTPASRGVFLRIRAAEVGTMTLSARLEHADSGEVVTFQLATIDHHQVDGIEILCLDGQLCGGPEEPNPQVVFGVVGLDGGTRVLVRPTLSFSSDIDDTVQFTSCSPEAYEDQQTGTGFSCQSRLYEFGGATQYTIEAEWMGHSAQLTAPSP